MPHPWGETWDENHPHSELTGAIIAAAIRVQKALGPGLLEDAYKACLAHALHQEGLKVLREIGPHVNPLHSTSGCRMLRQDRHGPPVQDYEHSLLPGARGCGAQDV